MKALEHLAQCIREDALLHGLQCYIVGGAVRDSLLGATVTDKDWVVVGATPQALIQRGFLPVGVDFPVFLHPHTKEEFALARTERKQGRGYRGFVFYTGTEVRLEEDLARRDLTINAMAVGRDGHLVDPFSGQRDLEQGWLRHVGAAFVEDPVRLLRLARFRARFVDFEVAEQTCAYAQALVESGEVDALVPERIWQEVSRGLSEDAPARMFEFLAQVGALARVCPSLHWTAEVSGWLTRGAARGLDEAQRFALLTSASAEPAAVGQAMRAPRACIDYAVHLQRLRRLLADKQDSDETACGERWTAAQTWQVLQTLDALRRPERFVALLQALSCLQAVDLDFWARASAVVKTVDAGAIARAHQGAPEDIPHAIAHARQQALVEQMGLA